MAALLGMANNDKVSRALLRLGSNLEPGVHWMDDGPGSRGLRKWKKQRIELEPALRAEASAVVDVPTDTAVEVCARVVGAGRGQGGEAKRRASRSTSRKVRLQPDKLPLVMFDEYKDLVKVNMMDCFVNIIICLFVPRLCRTARILKRVYTEKTH